MPQPAQKPTPQAVVAVWGVGGNKSLTMTYFHRRTSTIIGAKAFHGPVRDGKAWGHLAMVVKRNRVLGALWGAANESGKKHKRVVGAAIWFTRHMFATTARVIGSSRTGN